MVWYDDTTMVEYKDYKGGAKNRAGVVFVGNTPELHQHFKRLVEGLQCGTHTCSPPMATAVQSYVDTVGQSEQIVP